MTDRYLVHRSHLNGSGVSILRMALSADTIAPIHASALLLSLKKRRHNVLVPALLRDFKCSLASISVQVGQDRIWISTRSQKRIDEIQASRSRHHWKRSNTATIDIHIGIVRKKQANQFKNVAHLLRFKLLCTQLEHADTERRVPITVEVIDVNA
jgi:hypothetical protein